MDGKLLRMGLALVAVLFQVMVFIHAKEASAQPAVSTDRAVYPPDASIRVNFSGAPGNGRDWVCIAPSGTRDDDAGNFQYLPEGSGEGALVFGPQSVGEYEARAYYDYQTNGYKVSARCAFSVSDAPQSAGNRVEARAGQKATGKPKGAGNPDTSLNSMTRLAGQGTRMVGEVMEKMGEENAGTATGTLLSFGGKVYSSVGSAVEGSAKNDESLGESVGAAVSAGAGAVTNFHSGATSDRSLVRSAQQVLTRDGYYDGAADGIIGEKTTRAIQKFQRDNGIAVTGTLNTATCKALGI